jgi:SpoVK/Ycf46/Vps4 family AAA+-type ATPase
LKQEIVRWLSHGNDPETNHRAARKKHEEGTGKWFTESKEYARWKEEPNSFLWLYGIPGCGKTVLWSVPYSLVL